MAKARIMVPNDKLTFTVVQKTIPNNGVAFSVVDSEGYTCGYFATEKDAKKAISRIANNLRHGNCKPYKPKPKSLHRR